MIMECFISQCLLSESLIVLFETEEIWLINWLNIEKKEVLLLPQKFACGSGKSQELLRSMILRTMTVW